MFQLLTACLLDGISGLYELQSCANSDFFYEAGKQKLVHLDIFPPKEHMSQFITPNDYLNGNGENDAQGGYGLQGKLLNLAGHIDLESRATVGADYEWKVLS